MPSWFRRANREPDFYKKAVKQDKEEARRRRDKIMTTSVDPSKAITELQPWQVNQEAPTKTLGQYQYKDIYGRPITEPDLSNPTRSRWERPLDTIRSFQESIDRGYRRQSYYTDEPPGSPSESHWGPRSQMRNDEAANMMYANRATNSTTPLSNSSGEVEAYGVMAGRTALNDHMNTGMQAMPTRPRNQSQGSAPDTGYGSIDHSGNAYEPEYGWGRPPAHTAPRSPLSNQLSPSPAQQMPRSAIPLNSGGSTASKPAPPEKQRKSWLGKKLAKNK